MMFFFGLQPHLGAHPSHWEEATLPRNEMDDQGVQGE